MNINVNIETIKAAYQTIVSQQAQLTRLGQPRHEAIATLQLLEQTLQQAGEYSFIQSMKQQLQNPWSSF